MDPIVFYYFNMTGTESFKKHLEEKFRQTGHAASPQPMDIIRKLNIYHQINGDGITVVKQDLLIRAMTLSAVATGSSRESLPV